MNDTEENLYAKIFYIVGIMAATVVFIWVGYKICLIIKEKICKAKKNFLPHEGGLVLQPSGENEIAQTPNEDSGQKEVIYRNHRNDHSIPRCSKSGIL